MKRIIVLVALLSAMATLNANAQLLKKFTDKIKDKAAQKVDAAMDKGAQKVVDSPDSIAATASRTKKNPKAATTKSTSNAPSQAAASASNSLSPSSDPGGVVPAFKTYQNYDFVPGEQIVFEDNFTDDTNGEFPSHWKLVNGQAVMNRVDDKPSLLITDGNYGVVAPRMKKDHYLGDSFTLEFDFIYKKVTDIGYGSYSDAPGVDFYYKDPASGNEWQFRVVIGHDNVHVGEVLKTFPEALATNFDDKWHHVALIYKEGQMKTYVDQYRVCVNPNLENKPYRLVFDGIGSENAPIIFTNVKIANGGGMNIIGKKFTDTKIVTHGINFDINKANIKPESMGTLNGIVQILKDNPEVRFEVGGHTDSDGDDVANVKLSQARSDAVRAQLITMGIDGGRLTSKGYGKSKPISDNTTPDGKANNRRVEFVKL
ncbi:OmpA family protein [Mucilaginibacter flavidus]|uniref:OmpA family protein n=1 Tax=Mucilaginibacter flavidus TaxID=2949309 RepID=UPI002093F30E|nr:OmpA family protein [Mucilaginibacter flavidus]MCO5948096.1 OmpA family protein [Mucilaginibacter flavidus]